MKKIYSTLSKFLMIAIKCAVIIAVIAMIAQAQQTALKSMPIVAPMPYSGPSDIERLIVGGVILLGIGAFVIFDKSYRYSRPSNLRIHK